MCSQSDDPSQHDVTRVHESGEAFVASLEARDAASLTAEQLDALDALEKAATPGPWADYIDDYGDVETGRLGSMFITRNADDLEIGNLYIQNLTRSDARFITETRNALPALIAAARERDALREAIQNALNELGVPVDDYPAPVANAVGILRAALGGTDDR